jgi:hypothetical protein
VHDDLAGPLETCDLSAAGVDQNQAVLLNNNVIVEVGHVRTSCDCRARKPKSP